MKNKIILFLIPALILCSFSWGSDLPVEAHKKNSTISEVPVGGAYLLFAEKFGGEVTITQIKSQRELKVDGCAKGSRIFSFVIEITHKGETTTFSSKSNVLTKEIIASLANLKPGDHFEFKNTKAYLPNGKDVVEVHSRKFLVV